MQIRGKISILFETSGLKIEVYDEAACIRFLEIKLDQEQTCEALARLAHTPCVIEARELQNVGKVRESRDFTFQMPDDAVYRDKKVAQRLANELCPDGWRASTYFGSQNSFYTQDGKEYARTTIHRWVENPEEP